MYLKKHPILYTISAIIMILAGILCFIFPIVAADFLPVLLGIMLLIGGIFTIVAALTFRNRTNLHLGWFIAIAVMSIILAVLLLISPANFSASVIGYALIFFVLFSSVMDISYAIQAKSLGFSSWGWTLALGILGVIASVILLFSNAVVSQIFLGVYAGVFLLQEGITVLILALD